MANLGAPDEGDTITRRLWVDAQSQILLILHHPFVRALGDGTLAKKAFQSYILQDHFFLTAFSKAYSACLGKASDVSQEVFQTVKELLASVHEELNLHHSYAQEWGVQLDSTHQPNVAVCNYTKFLLRLAEGHQSLVEVMVAMAPCARLYGYLGCQLTRSLHNSHFATSAAAGNGSGSGSDHPYSHWIRTYSSPSFCSMVAKQEAIINRYGRQLPYESLRSLYCTAMRFEAQFFGDHPAAPQQPHVALLAVDFDETCSRRDTIGVVMDTAIDAAVARARSPSETHKQLTATRDQLVADYSCGHAALMAELMPEDSQDAAGYDDEWLGGFTARLSAFDRTMNEVVERSSVLASATAADLSSTGTKVELQDGCAAVLQRALREGTSCHVISVNWSSHLIQAALQSGGNIAAVTSSTTEAPFDSASGLIIHSNDLTLDDEGVTTGRIDGRVVCSEDKAVVFETVLLDVAAESGCQGGLSVFVGDSPSDLAALTAADVGIVVGSKPLLRRVAAAAGIRLQPLVAAGMVRRAPAGVLFEASGWPEIGAFLFGEEAAIAEPTAASTQQVPRVLVVAGSDSGGGAGIQADLKTCAALGAFGMTAVTALTAQNTLGVHHVHTPPAAAVVAQMDAVLCDIGTDAIKTGMLASAEIVEAVAEKIAAVPEEKRPPLVVDPVLVATSGASLGCSGVAAAMKRHLLPLATLLTPNLPEASAMLEGRHIHDIADMKSAAEELHRMGPQYVLVKGGHLVSSHLQSEQQAVDVLFDGVSHHIFSEPVVRTGNSHGTGCTLATAVAVGLAKGLLMKDAVHQAKQYVTQALHASQFLAIGTGDNKPFNHAYATTEWGPESVDLSPEAKTLEGAPGLSDETLRLYAVTDQACDKRWGRPLKQSVEAALDGGAGVVQLRLKNTDGSVFLREARQVVAACRAGGALAIINDRVDVALAAGAHGVHVGQDDMGAEDVRRLIGPHRILGVSVKTKQEALAAAAGGATYLGAGALFPTSTKQTDNITEFTLREICAAVDIPVVAIGGLSAANAGVAINAGCKGVAVVSALFDREDVASAARKILKEVEAAVARQNAHT